MVDLTSIEPSTEPRELMARARTGDTDAYTQLYTQYRAYVLRITRACHPGHAEDVAQDVWVRVLSCLHLWQDRGTSPLAWIAVITRNICRDRAKSAYVQRVNPVEQVPERCGDPERHDPELLTVREYARRDARRDVLAALEQISPRQHQALTLYYLDELSTAEVAARMGLSVGRVKNLLHHGRVSMARKLAPAVADA